MENPAMESKHGDAIVCATTACLRARLGTTPMRSGSGCAVTYGVLFSMPCPYGTATADSIAVRGVAFARFAPGPRTGRTSRPDAPGRNGRGMCARGPPFFATGASLPLVEAGRERKPPQPRHTRLRLRWRRPRNPQVFRGFVVRHVVAFLEREPGRSNSAERGALPWADLRRRA